MQEDISKKKIPIKIIVILALIFIMIPITIFILTILTAQPKPSEDHSEHTTPTIILENSYQLEYSIGHVLSDYLTSALAAEILKEPELESAPLPNDTDNIPFNTYRATLVETSFKRLPNQPPITYSFNLTVSDGRTYGIYLHVYEDPSYVENYLAALIKRTDIANGTSSAYIYYRDPADLPVLIAWTKAIDTKSSIVFQEQLQDPDS